MILWRQNSYDHVKDATRIRDCFTFSQERLLEYIRENQLSDEIYGTALDNRASSSPYISEKGGVYEVGWLEFTTSNHYVTSLVHSMQRKHNSLDEAAADYVCAYWGLRRLGD